MDLSKTLTIYGRKAVLEALEDPTLSPQRLHMADTNKDGGIVDQIKRAAQTREVDVQYHDRLSLSRISKNGKQDQGVALDLFCPKFNSLEGFLEQSMENTSRPFRAVLLDGITNPQNVGMIIRSCCAAGVDAIFYPRRSVATLGPLVIKASVGTVFRAPIVQCNETAASLMKLQDHGMCIAVLDGHAEHSLFEFTPPSAIVYVLGGESEGATQRVKNAANISLRIPMANGVESLNVAVTAALVSFYKPESHQLR